MGSIGFIFKPYVTHAIFSHRTAMFSELKFGMRSIGVIINMLKVSAKSKVLSYAEAVNPLKVGILYWGKN
jgi:hypothetical protein